MTPDERPSKRDAFLAFLHAGWVSLHLDARRPGVDVPDTLREEPHLVLQYGRNMPIPIPDLEVTDDGVCATLSFQRTPHRTQIPWSAVYAVACTDGRGVLYQEDVPPEVTLVAPIAEAQSEAEAEAEAEGEADETQPVEVSHRANGFASRTGHGRADRAPPRAVPLLRSIPAETDDPLSDDATGPRRRRRPQLRLVK